MNGWFIERIIDIVSHFISKDPIKARHFFDPIVNDLNLLQEKGILVNGIRIRFSFSTIAADNLAAHYLGGFQTNFSSGHFCRRCLISYNDRLRPLDSTISMPRTIREHDMCVEHLRLNPNGKPVFGITGPSVFDGLTNFHPTTAFPPDLMHDIFEGVCPLVILILLKEASTSRIITYGEIFLFKFFYHHLVIDRKQDILENLKQSSCL